MIEGIIQISEQVSIEDVEAIVNELDRMQAAPPMFQIRGVPSMHRIIPKYSAMTKAFLAFRRSLESVEG